MTDQDPFDQPTRVDLPAVDPTRAIPASGPPAGRPPRPTGGPPSGGDDHRWWILGALLVLILVVGITALLVSDGDGASRAADTTTTSAESTTTSSSTTTTEATTTTQASTTTTTESPRATVAPGLCHAGDPDDPDMGVQVLYQAYTLDDRVCAYQLGTEDAVDTLFGIPGRGSGWTYQGCDEGDESDEYIDCAFTFDGGATHFHTSFSDADGWIVTEVVQTVD